MLSGRGSLSIPYTLAVLPTIAWQQSSCKDVTWIKIQCIFDLNAQAASTNLSAPPQPLHAIPAQGHPAQLLKALRDVEVHKRGHFVEPHVVPLCVPLSIFLLHLRINLFLVSSETFPAYLSVEGQVQPVSNKDLGDAWGMLLHLLHPPVHAFEAPLVGDVVHKQDALRPPAVAPNDRTKPT